MRPMKRLTTNFGTDIIQRAELVVRTVGIDLGDADVTVEYGFNRPILKRKFGLLELETGGLDGTARSIQRGRQYGPAVGRSGVTLVKSAGIFKVEFRQLHGESFLAAVEFNENIPLSDKLAGLKIDGDDLARGSRMDLGREHRS